MQRNGVTTKGKSGKWTSFREGRGGILGISAKDSQDMIDRVGAGFAFNALIRFQKASGLPLAVIADILQIPPRTLARRRAGGRLSSLESDRLLRFAALFERAVSLFEGDVAAARAWLTRPVRALGYQQPLSYAKTEIGAREVEHVIGRLEHGVFM